MLRFRPRLECLEDRTTPSTLLVTNSLDTGISGDGSLRGEIAAAVSGDTIQIQSTSPIVLASSLNLTKNLTIEGNGQTIFGNNAVQVFTIGAGLTESFSDLTIANGKASGIYGGGGILLNANDNITLTDCTFSNNSVMLASGGAIAGLGNDTMFITGCTFMGNSAAVGNGGAIAAATGGNGLVVSDSTFSGNSVGGLFGGAISFQGSLAVSNSTFSGNSANAGSGGAIANDVNGTMTLYDSILSGNTAANGANVYNANTPTAVAISLGDNLYGASVGVSWAVGDVQANNPMLGTLQNNGGQTPTMLLLTGSPALGAGNVADAPPADQRGLARIVNGKIDIGAVEMPDPPPVDPPPAPKPTFKLVVEWLPASAVSKAGSASFFMVEVIDASGKVMKDYRGTIHFTSTDLKGVLPANYTFKASDMGSHIFKVVFNTAGEQTLTIDDTAFPTFSVQLKVDVRSHR